jgi:RNA polymerase sigma-70 factor (ECF subfamily)
MTITSVPASAVPDSESAARFARDAEPLLDVLSRRARRLTRCEADAEDLLQDTLLHAYAGFATFKQGSNLKAWLFRILYNRWVSGYRAKQSRPQEISVDELTDGHLASSAMRQPGAMCSAEAEVLDAMSDGDVRAAMAAIPEGFRVALFYADVEGYTCAETAAILGIPIGTVMSRVSRARRRLRVALAHLAHDRADAVIPATA